MTVNQNDDSKRWDKRERVVCGPGDNRSRAKARKAAKRRGNKDARRTGRLSERPPSEQRVPE